MYQSDQINELVSALSKAQGEISPAIKDSNNPFFKSKYADLSSVWNACKDPLSRHGLAVIQCMDYKDGQLFLITTLAHGSGQWMRSYMPIITEKNNAQGIGSAITYMRRYSLSAIAGITCDEDDDGNAAVNLPDKKNQSYKTKTPDPKKLDIPPNVGPDIVFQIPPDVNPDRMNIFMYEQAKSYGRSLNEVNQRANENPEGFLEVFEKWDKKTFEYV